MCVLDYEGKMEKKEVWSTSDIVNNRNNWSLAADAELLKYLQTLSEKVFSQANSSLQSLNSLENDINQTCISVANSSNKFKALSDTQFIESKIQEETLDSNEPPHVVNESTDFKNEDITVKLKEALENGFQVLDSQYDIIPVSGSDSEGDEPQDILLRARNPYLMRRLPYIIGSNEFTRNDTLGLVDTSSSEEEDEEEEAGDEDEDEDEGGSEEESKIEHESDSENEKNVIPKPPAPLPRTEFTRPQTQVIRISSSDSEDSEVSIPSNRSKKEEIEKSKKDGPTQIPYSFADHLNAALKSNRNTVDANAYNVIQNIPPDFGDSFSPPPFPGKDTNISSDDEHSDSSDDDFVTKKNTKHSLSGTSYVKSYSNDEESDDNDDLYDNSKLWRRNEIGVISSDSPVLGKTLKSSRKSSIISKTSQHSDSSNSPSLDNEIRGKSAYPTNDHATLQLPVKPKIGESNINSLNKKMASAINAELNEKLKIKTPVEATENITPAKTTKPTKSVSSTPTTKKQQTVSAKKEIKKPVLFGELDDENTQANTSDDLFSGLVASKSKTAPVTKKTSSLFDDDDDNIENLFKSSKPAPKEISKRSQLDDLFHSTTGESVKIDKPTNEPANKTVTKDLFQKSNLFASDSDSEDDLFLLIKNQKRTTSSDIFKTKKVDPFKDNSDRKSAPAEPVDRTQSLFTEHVSKNSPEPRHESTSQISNNESVSETLLFPDDAINTEKNSKPSDQISEQTIREESSISHIASSKNNSFEETSKSAVLDLFDDNDSFSKNMKPSTDKQTPLSDKIVDAPKPANLFADNDKNQIKITDIADPVSTSASLDEKFIFETPPEFPRETSSSNESLNKDSKNVEKINVFDKKDNIFAKNLISRYSSSEDEEDDVPGDISRYDDVPPINEHLFNKKPESEVIQGIDERDLFGEKFPSSPNKTPIEETVDFKSPVEDDLFGENIKAVKPKDIKTRPISLFDENEDDLFGEIKKTDIKPQDSSDKKCTKELPPEKIHNERLEESRLKIDPELEKKDISTESDTVIENPDFTSITSGEKPKGELFAKQKEPLLFNFSKKDLFKDDSDSDEFEFLKNPIPVSKPSSLVGSQESTISKDSQKREEPEKEESNSITNQVKKLNQKFEGISDQGKRPFSREIEESGNRNLNKTEDIEKESNADEQDGNIFAKNASPEPVAPLARTTPGKLAVNRGLNINVSALLPGANRSSKIKPTLVTEPVIADEPVNGAEQSTNLLNNVTKERAKISVRRRPPSRQARKSRVLNNDLFAPTEDRDLQTSKRESPLKENKSVTSPNEPTSLSTPTKSKMSDAKVEIEKQNDKPDTKIFKERLFDEDDDNDDKMNNLFQTIGNEVKKDKKSSTGEGNEEHTSSEISNLPRASQHSAFDDELNVGVISAQGPLRSFTKDRAKRVRRNVSSKSTAPETPAVFQKEENKSPEIAIETSTMKPDIFSDEIFSSSSTDKSPPKGPSKTPTLVKGLFEDLEDDDDDLFGSIKSKKVDENPKSEEAAVKKETNLPSSSSTQKQSKPQPTKISKIDIFKDDDDDELFAAPKAKFTGNKLPKKNVLFEDTDDDDNLFGTKSSSKSAKKTIDPPSSTIKAKVSSAKPRVNKLRSETVQKDPLTGKDLTSLR